MEIYAIELGCAADIQLLCCIWQNISSLGKHQNWTRIIEYNHLVKPIQKISVNSIFTLREFGIFHFTLNYNSTCLNYRSVGVSCPGRNNLKIHKFLRLYQTV